MSDFAARVRARQARIRFWQVALGGVVYAAATFALLWGGAIAAFVLFDIRD